MISSNASLVPAAIQPPDHLKNWDAYNAINSSSTKLFLSLSSFFSKVSEYFGKIFFNLLNNLCEFSEGDRNMHSLDAPREPPLTLRAQSEAHYAEALGYVDLKAVEGRGPFRRESRCQTTTLRNI